MNSMILSVAWGTLLASVLQAAAPHPTLLTAQYKGELLPVVRVIDTDPVVLLSGKEKRIRSQCMLMPQRTAAFGAGYVEINAKKVSTSGAWAMRPDMGTPATLYFEAEFKATDGLRGGFLLIGASIVGSGPGTETLINTSFMVRQLPDLPPAKPTKLKFQQSLPNGASNMDHFVQVFDAGGREIPTNESASAWNYYALLEQVQLRDALPRYLAQFSGQDHDPFPVVQPRPLLPGGQLRLPEGLKAALRVSADGRVEQVSVEGLSDATQLKTITEAMEGWLFFPRLERGKPVPCVVEVTVEA